MRENLGWNTWDVSHVNGVVHLESGIRLRVGLMDETTGERREHFNWKDNLGGLGPHSGRTLGYARIELIWNEAHVSLEFAVEADRLVCRISTVNGMKLKAVVVLDSIWEAQNRTVLEKDLIRIYSGGDVWAARPVHSFPVYAERNEMILSLDKPAIFEIVKEGAPVASSVEDVLSEQWSIYDLIRLKTSGWLGNSADGLTRSIHWNTIWEPQKGRVCTPVSREWCTNSTWGGYVLFEWDTFFCALMSALESTDLAIDNVRAVLQGMTKENFIPNFSSAQSVSQDRSQPPVGSYCVLKLWRGMWLSEPSGRRRLLSEIFEPLYQWHQWWMSHRDGNGDGLLEWGSNHLDDPNAMENHTLRAAMYESGLDNSPMYDEAIFNQDANTMELADVGLNSLYALDAWALGELAIEIGRNEEARQLQQEYEVMAERINALLWNETAGIYQNRDWSGRFSSHLSPTLFYPLLAGIVPPSRARRMVYEHLLNEHEFWGEFILPSISRSDPGYRRTEIIREGIAEPTNDYWRGRIWGPMNFLVNEGLKRYGLYAESQEFSQKSVRLFNLEWESKNHVHENYNDLNGDGDDVNSSNALYHWGSLLAYIGIQELADCEAWGGWRFGNLSDEAGAVKGILVEEGRIEVSCSQSGLEVCLDDAIILKSDAPVIVRGYRAHSGKLQFGVIGKTERVTLKIGLPGAAEGTLAKLRMGQVFELGLIQTAVTDSEGIIEILAPVPGEIEVTW